MQMMAVNRKKYYIKTYGCAMNYADSNRIRAFLNNSGMYETLDYKDADVIILNSCSVRGQAEDKIAGWGIKLKSKQYKHCKVILTGCMAVRYDRKNMQKNIKYENSLKRRFPWIDRIIEIKDIDSIKEFLEIKLDDGYSQKTDGIGISDKVHGLIPISSGCDNFCSYCIVPFSRGELEDYTYKQIISQVSRFLDEGGRWITLLGQNVNSWRGIKNGIVIDFADLLNDIGSIPGEFWISFLSSNPMDFDEKLIGTVKSNAKIIRWINLAVQSGSDRILRNMNRKYTVDIFKQIVEGIRGDDALYNVSTDIIVGYPGETEEDFQASLQLVKDMKFSMVYVGKYSAREGALSAKLPDKISPLIKDQRETLLKKEVNKLREEYNLKWVGQDILVLATGGKRGITYYGHEVIFEDTLDGNDVGEIFLCKVVGSSVKGLKVAKKT